MSDASQRKGVELHSPDNVLDPVREEEHEREVMELAVDWDGLVLLCRSTDIDAILGLALGNDACEG